MATDEDRDWALERGYVGLAILVRRRSAWVAVIMLALSALAFAVSFWIARVTCDPQWFSRSGSLVVAVALGLVAPLQWSDAVMAGRWDSSNENAAKLGLGNPLIVVPGLAFIATLVWGYGDLAVSLPSTCGERS